MPLFVSQKELDELRAKAAKGSDVARVEKAYKKQINQMQIDHDEAIEDLRDESDRKIHVLTRKVNKADVLREDAVKDATAEHKNLVEDLKRDHKAAMDEMADANESLEGKIEVLNERVATAADLTKREHTISDKEDEIERAAEFLSNREKDFDKKVKEFDKRVLDENESQYKKGYTDGVSDTLREGNELANTANERVFKLADKAVEPRSKSETSAPVTINNQN